jgi:DNA (cytosine-5)-methyltransferase 1
MVARLQGFPSDWVFTGSKTSSYRQVGNAFPPLVAQAVGSQIVKAFKMYKTFVEHRITAERKLA